MKSEHAIVIPVMGVNSKILLQFRSIGFGSGEVFVTAGGRDVLVYTGSAAKTVYEALQKYTCERKEGTGQFYEQQTTSGVQWREKV